MKEKYSLDVIIIGGSYSGLSAALALGRSLKKVLVLDHGKPCNIQTPHSHNFLSRDGAAPSEIAIIARRQLAVYDTVRFYDDMAVSAAKKGIGFEVTMLDGHVFEAAKLIIATGIKDVFPDLRGFEACWGISVIHCPYCHGYEFRGKKTGIFANGEKAFHVASLVHNLTGFITLFTNGKPDFNEEQMQKLANNGIAIIETELAAIEHRDGYLRHVLLKDGSSIALDALYAGIPFIQHSDIPQSLGCALTEQGWVEVNSFQQTSAPGVYACGDNSSMMRSVANAVYTGNIAGVMVNKELTDERF